MRFTCLWDINHSSYHKRLVKTNAGVKLPEIFVKDCEYIILTLLSCQTGRKHRVAISRNIFAF